MPDQSERKLATVLFADLVDSTAAAAGQDPERTRLRLERFYEAMSAEIAAAGGTVEKFAGDAVMAVFGAPEALEDHAERALHTALAMQRRLESDFAGELALRIGVNTGDVVAGRAREGSSFVSGDAVNVAARLEQAAEGGEILAGERTVAAVRGAFEFDEPTIVEAKGKPDGVAARRVTGALSLMRTRGVGGLKRSFVGRDEQLAQLMSAYRRTLEHSRPGLITIVGDPGVGKTRLVRELWEQLEEEQPEPMRRTGRCLPYGQGITYWPLGEMLKEHLDIRESDPPDEVHRRLGDRAILGLTLGLDVAGDLHPLAAQDRLHAAWLEFLSQQASQRPVVLLIEDVHWAEAPLLGLLERLARDVSGPLLLIATARPDFGSNRLGWGARVDSETIWLEPLPDDAAALLVDSLLADEMAPKVRELIVERAEGNPFFVEEVLGSLIDAGVLARANGGWQVSELPTGFEIPDSVQAVLAARIDLLGEAEKTALQAAAVIGRTFWTGPVYELVERLEPDLHLLERRDFIRRRPSSSLEGEVEYAFKHALTRDVAYAGLTKVRRAQLHWRFAEWLERLGEGREDHAPLLAHHYAEAVKPEDVNVVWPDEGPVYEHLRGKAVFWLQQAADAAISRYEIDDAVDLLTRAAVLEPDDGAQALLYRRLGQANALRYDGEGLIAAMERALTLAPDAEQTAETYAELAFEASMRSGMWRRRPGRDVMDEWTSRALAGVQPGTEAHVRALISRVFGGFDNAEECAALAGKYVDELGDAGLESALLDARGMSSFRRFDFDLADAQETQRFGFIPRLTNPDLIHDIYISSIPTAAAVGELGRARTLAEDLEEVVAPLTTHHRVHGIACKLEVEELAGNWQAIGALEARTQELVEANRQTPCVRNERSLLLLAIANEWQGNHARSRELEEHAQELRGEGYGATLATPLARLSLMRGELDRLEELLADDEWLSRQTWFTLPAGATRLDVLSVIGDISAVQEAAAELAVRPSYLQPFALRALGIVRDDDKLLARADEGFRMLQLDWHAEQTGPLREFRKLAAG